MKNSELSHELFETKERSENWRIRPERYSSAGWPMTLSVNGKTLEVINFSAFGVAALTSSEVENESNEVQAAVVEIAGLHIQDVEIRVLYSTTLAGREKRIVYEILNEPLDVELAQGVIKGLFATKEIELLAAESARVHAEFKYAVGDVFDFLSTVRDALNAQENRIKSEGGSSFHRELEGVCVATTKLLISSMPKFYERLESAFRSCSTEDESSARNCMDYLRGKLSTLIYGAPIAKRSFTKPSGYAGDYEMMNLIYRDSFEGETLYEKCMHKYFIEQAAAKAVKNRARFLLEQIEQTVSRSSGVIHIASLASGPAYEVQLFCQKINPALEINFHFFDQDLNALQHAQRYITENCMRFGVRNVKSHFYNLAIKNILGRGFPSNLKFDLTYCAGLFDYLSAPVAKACVRQMARSTRENGLVVIGNFDVSNPTRSVMEFALDWNLIHRTADDMIAICNDFLTQVEVKYESEGVNLFVVGKR
jgi:extracellular factor (EF) 3-hydroxypalmitic acid methyl ester biosynthesis protein